MSISLHSVVSTVSSVRSLSRTAWGIGISLQKLDQNAQIFDIPVRSLNDETRLLGAECDHLYEELDDVVRKNETGSLEPSDVDTKVWTCVATQVTETSRIIHELEQFVQGVVIEGNTFIDQIQYPSKQDSGKDLANIRGDLRRLSQSLHTTLLLIKTVYMTLRSDGRPFEELESLKHMVDRMERSTEGDPCFRLSRTEAVLLQCAHEVIAKEAANNSVNVAQWPIALKSIRLDQQYLSKSDTTIKALSNLHGQQNFEVGSESVVPIADDEYEDDLFQELAKVALETGNTAFEAQEWNEAGSLLQEALRAVQQLPQQQRTFCDLFDLHYKLAISAYHTQEPASAEETLKSFVRQTANSDEQRRSIYNAQHQLSQLYIRMSHIERAREECERALSARRRMFGKQSDASMESMALMAHIYVLLNQQPRAKVYLAMIPEKKRDAILVLVEESLGPEVQHLDFELLLKSIPASVAGDSQWIRWDGQSVRGDDQSVRGETLSARRESLPNRIESGLVVEQMHDSIISETAYASPMGTSEFSSTFPKPPLPQHSTTPIISNPFPSHRPSPPAVNPQSLSRQEILDRIGCQPRDAIEEAVCSSDAIALASLLHKRKHSWRIKLRGRVRPERVTALHFAALFGEIDMARHLLAANFNINEVPYGYSNPLTPLAFAVGARQVDMVDFLLNNGARPPEPDSWSTLAGQLLTKAWLEKTLSNSEKDIAFSHIISIFAILRNYGWNINSPYERSSGKTVLHQAVTFWTGDYKWDLELRKQVTRFLRENGADPWVVNAEGKTPWDLAKASGHEELLLLGAHETGKQKRDWREELAELSG